MAETAERLPGENLINKGLKDLGQEILSMEALLVLIGSPRLKRMGLSIPVPKNFSGSPEHALYNRLQSENPRGAHSRYNALIRRLVSFERTLERQMGET